MESDLGALGRELLNDLERLRPAFPDQATPEEVETVVAERVAVRLPELYKERFEQEPEAEATARLAMFRREIEQILIPRYVALARHENHLERHRPRPWTGGDAVNRACYGGLFLLLGFLVVWAPFIPIWEKWIPWALGGLAVVFAPALPDLSRRVRRRHFKLSLLKLLIDVDQAGKALPAAPVTPLLDE